MYTILGHTVLFSPKNLLYSVYHILHQAVPPSIPVPPYVGSGHDVAPVGDSIITLGGEEEARARRAGALASKVREFAGSLVKVR